MSNDENIVPLQLVRNDLLAAEEPPFEEPPPAPEEGETVTPSSATAGRARRRRRQAEVDAPPAGGGFGAYGPIPLGPHGLPEECPVRPVGVKDDTFFYLDAIDQLRALKGEKHGRLNVVTLFQGDRVALQRYWPKINADGEVTGINFDLAAEALMRSASRQGIWNPLERVRGPGAWSGANSELVLHCGTKILVFPAFDGDGRPSQNPWGKLREIAPGMEGRFVYPGDASGPQPHQSRQAAGTAGPAEELLSYLKTWSWKRGELDARLLLGWICAAMIGGALKWRPATWLTGGRGTGKSTLMDLIRDVLDDVVMTSDSSEAGLRQVIGHRTFPVLLDEMEADPDNRRGTGVIKLARQAASGGVVLRGGQDHVASEFVVRSCFLFSSIVVQSMPAQDQSRLAFLELGPLGDHPPPKVSPQQLRDLGARLRRRLVDGWPRLAAAIEIYRDALNAEQRDARRADVFGTLLGCAEVALADGLPDSAYAREWVFELEGAESGLDDEEKDELRMLNKLLSTQIEIWRGGGRPTVGELIQAAAHTDAFDGIEPKDADKALQRIGLKIEFETKQPAWLLVANRHDGLMKIFENTHWAGRPGASAPLVQALRRLPGAEADAKLSYFAGVTSRATRVPLALVLAPVPADRAAVPT